jgi:hypothetical protein
MLRMVSRTSNLGSLGRMGQSNKHPVCGTTPHRLVGFVHKIVPENPVSGRLNPYANPYTRSHSPKRWLACAGR